MFFYLQKIVMNETNNISFDEGPHIYTIKGKSDYESVTTWVHKQFEEFDADKIINNMMKNSEKWRLNKYYGMTKQEIIDMWNKNRDDAADAGTKLHYSIEYFYNHNENMIMKPNVETTTQDTMDHSRPEWLDDLICNSIEYEYFLNFHKDHEYLTPYRTEWMIYDEELKLAGSIDMVFEELDGSLSIYDWKRCKEIVKTSRYNKYSTNETINYLPGHKLLALLFAIKHIQSAVREKLWCYYKTSVLGVFAFQSQKLCEDFGS